MLLTMSSLLGVASNQLITLSDNIAFIEGDHILGVAVIVVNPGIIPLIKFSVPPLVFRLIQTMQYYSSS